MRTMPSSLAAKFKQLVQADSTKAAPALDLWISRPVVPLVNDYFLEQQAVQDGTNVTAVDIAVCHPRHRRQSTKIYMARVESGKAKVLSSPFRHAMEAHVWTDCGFSEAAEDVAVAFDAVMKNDTRGRAEFVTEELPWVFWVSGGALYGRKLGSEDTVTLAEANCTKCTAIRASKSAIGDFDFGLCLFFLLSGQIYVRQLIGGEWMDAEVVFFGPSEASWEEIAAFRTWDYRIGLQAKTADGVVYELFTQFMGIGKRNEEHVSVDARSKFDLTRIRKWYPSNEEHAVTIASAESGAPYGGLYSVLPPNIVEAYNIDDGSGDWGKKLVIVTDVHLRFDEIAANYASFFITDSLGRTFSAYSAELSVEDAKTITLTFEDFNAANGECVVSYTPGTAVTMADTLMENMEFAFTPVNLVPPEAPAPEVVDIWNVDSNGNEIAMKFTEPLTGDPIGNDDAFTISFQEYDMVPEGTLFEQNRHPLGVKKFITVDETVDLSNGTFSDVVFELGYIRLRKTGE